MRSLRSLFLRRLLRLSRCRYAGSEGNRRSENLRIIENGVRKAAAECYAVEGFYPDNIGYLIENYDLHIDKNSCIVHYSPVSSNIMPDIKVIAK